MSSALDLCNALQATGTGEKKLGILRRLAKERPQATGEDALIALQEAHAPEGTIAKARKLLNGARVSDFEGKPPPNHQAARDKALATELATQFADAVGLKMAEAQSKGVANPTKMATADKDKLPRQN